MEVKIPKIATYEAPEGIGLRPTETGISAVAAAARRVQGEYNEAAAAQIGTGNRIESAIKGAGDVAVKYLEHRAISQGAPAFAGIMAAKTKQWEDIQKTADPNDPTVATRFREGLEEDLQKFKDGMSFTEGGQKWAETHIDQYRQHMFVKTAADMANNAKVATGANVRKLENNLSVDLQNDPSETNLRQKLGFLDSSIGALVDSSPNLTGTAAHKIELTQTAKERLVKGAALGYIEKTGQVPEWVNKKEFKDYVNGAELRQLAQVSRYYQKLERSEERATRLETEHVAKQKLNTDIVNLEMSLRDPNTGEPVASPRHLQELRKIIKQNELGVSLEPSIVRSAETKIDSVLDRMGKPEALARVSHETTMDLLGRMRATDDSKITTNDAIYDAYRQNKLTTADFNFLNKQFSEMRTPEGERLNRTVTDFMKAVAPQIDKSNPLMGKLDQDGKLNTYRMEWDINAKIAEYRKAGKDPYDLFNPSKPDFMGRPEAILQYQKPMADSIKDQARRVMGRPSPPALAPDEPTPSPTPVIPPRKKGEDLGSFFNRIGIK